MPSVVSGVTRVQLVDPATGNEYRTQTGNTSDNLNTGQVAVGTSSTLVVPARAARKKATLTPTSSTVYYIGNSGVTTANGLYVAAGAAITLDTTAAIYAVGSAALTVSFVEYF